MPENSARDHSVIAGKPASVNRKQVSAVSTNAITWLLVIADMHEPTARNAPAMMKAPM